MADNHRMHTAAKLIQDLVLEPHVEGGYYRRIYTATQTLGETSSRPLATAIYYLLTAESPIGYWHKNCSDILHMYHAGSPLTYWLINPAGELTTHQLGTNIHQGQQMQLFVPGGYWKATTLVTGEYGLLSEVVIPGFEYAEMQLATDCDIKDLVYFDVWNNIKHLIKPQ